MVRLLKRTKMRPGARGSGDNGQRSALNDREGTMRIIGYGEDGLTYWALTTQLRDILGQLEDDTPPEQCTVFFRPSFGRAGGPKSPQFGEFDSILATQNAVYLMESKWDHGAPRNPSDMVLEEVQIMRHRIFTWLRNRWHDLQPENWDRFREAAEADFTEEFPYRPLAAGRRLLARNLGYILDQLCRNEFGNDTHNVLLYFHRVNTPQPKRIVDAARNNLNDFTLVCLNYPALGQSGYFPMDQ